MGAGGGVSEAGKAVEGKGRAITEGEGLSVASKMRREIEEKAEGVRID